MVDDKLVMDQVHEYKNLVADVLNEGMKMCEVLQADVLLKKFLSFWSYYQNQLKHKKDLSLQELISPMRIEEANRLKDKLNSIVVNYVKADLVVSSEVANRECVYMGNFATVSVLGIGKILLKLTSRKSLALNDVLYVPSMHRNLVYGSLL
ncbi:hypothetical protein K2173_022995 [Erythroxylum novogranatense]|uniref:Retrovirus-related Pol polyprotein from transposon TNT 1-94-like beta-barrel domain-containing protein n=1 Tax=Erythroxylum novogranatense TaxID=1862640 RepID=A0AAV8T7U4_9ROSI|nr:hypothetical protein K2173_022995 [Erythroxylum novogranatense]